MFFYKWDIMLCAYIHIYSYTDQLFLLFQGGKSYHQTLQEINSLSSINNDLYNFALKKLLRKKSVAKTMSP